MMTRETFGTRASVLALASLILLSFAVTLHSATDSADRSLKAGESDFKRLEGKWQRPDGGYVLELKEIAKDGTVRTAYFNPRPINVAKAELKRKDGMLTVFVELRDVNYPGVEVQPAVRPQAGPAGRDVLPGSGETDL